MRGKSVTEKDDRCCLKGLLREQQHAWGTAQQQLQHWQHKQQSLCQFVLLLLQQTRVS
jgi:hypothetical protein